MDGNTLAEQLASNEGLHPPLVVAGFVRKTSDAKVIEFSPGVYPPDRRLKIPVGMIKEGTVLEKRAQQDGTYDFVIIEFDWPANAEAQVLASLLQEQTTDQETDEAYSDISNYIDTMDSTASRAWESARRLKEKFGPGVPGVRFPWSILTTPTKTGMAEYYGPMPPPRPRYPGHPGPARPPGRPGRHR